jgi:hypothetical protein
MSADHIHTADTVDFNIVPGRAFCRTCDRTVEVEAPRPGAGLAALVLSNAGSVEVAIERVTALRDRIEAKGRLDSEQGRDVLAALAILEAQR